MSSIPTTKVVRGTLAVSGCRPSRKPPADSTASNAVTSPDTTSRSAAKRSASASTISSLVRPPSQSSQTNRPVLLSASARLARSGLSDCGAIRTSSSLTANCLMTGCLAGRGTPAREGEDEFRQHFTARCSAAIRLDATASTDNLGACCRATTQIHLQGLDRAEYIWVVRPRTLRRGRGYWRGRGRGHGRGRGD